MPKFFAWNQKTPEKTPDAAKKSLALNPLFIAKDDERRRAVRIPTPENIEVILKLDEKELRPAVADMSTLGIGLMTDFVPKGENALLVFQKPELFKEMQISLIKRHVEKQSQEGPEQYQIGYEFVFSSSRQQSLLLQWLALSLQYLNLSETGKEKDKNRSFSTAFYSELFNGLEFHLPATLDEFEQSLELVAPLTIHHALIQTKFFLMRQKNLVIGIVPLIPDTVPFKLIGDNFFPEYLSSLRSSGKRLAEISMPQFKNDIPLLKNPSSAQLRKLQILFALFPYLISYARNFARLTDLVALVPPNLAEFFRLWLFEELGPEIKRVDKNSNQIKDGFRLMRLSLREMDERLASDRPELALSLRKIEEASSYLTIFQEGYFPDADTLKKWFAERTSLFQGLNPTQTTYFSSLVPSLKL